MLTRAEIDERLADPTRMPWLYKEENEALQTARQLALALDRAIAFIPAKVCGTDTVLRDTCVWLEGRDE